MAFLLVDENDVIARRAFFLISQKCKDAKRDKNSYTRIYFPSWGKNLVELFYCFGKHLWNVVGAHFLPLVNAIKLPSVL